MDKLLQQLGIVTSQDRIFDFIKNFVFRNPTLEFSDLLEALTSFLDVHNGEVKARKILVFMREAKLISIREGKVYLSSKIKKHLKRRQEYLRQTPFTPLKNQPIILKESGVIVERGGNRYKLYDDGRIGMFA